MKRKPKQPEKLFYRTTFEEWSRCRGLPDYHAEIQNLREGWDQACMILWADFEARADEGDPAERDFWRRAARLALARKAEAKP